MSSTHRQDPFIPMAADLARCALMIRRGAAARDLDQIMRPTPVGRTRETSAGAILTLTAFALQHFQHARYRDVHRILHGMYSESVLSWLGLVARDDSGSSHPISNHQWRNFWRILYTRTSGEELLQVTNNLLLSWVDDPPLGDTLLFDSTAHRSSARPLAADIKKQLIAEQSPDFLLEEERRTLTSQEKRLLRYARSHRAHEGAWGHATATYEQPSGLLGGYHAHPVICASSHQHAAAAPTLVLATDCTPASAFSSPAELLLLLDSINDRYGTEFVIVADRDYSKKLELWSALRELGRKFAFDLNEKQLLPRGEHKGVLLAQGNCLCPATPKHLVNPGPRPMTKIRGRTNPKYETWLSAIRDQLAYRCHIRAYTPSGLKVSCPALGPSPTVDCPLRGPIPGDSLRPVVLEPPAPPPPICTQQTVFVPDQINDLRQTWPWARKDWLSIYRPGRSHNEGVHGELKNPDGFDLRRKVCGSSRIAVVAVHLALVEALYNLANLRTWVHQHPEHPFSRAAATDPLLGPDELAIAWMRGELGRSG